MSDEASFLKSIADQPGECSSRLVYADWLDEHDRPREAEFLRLQLQVEEMNTRLLELGGQLDAKWLTAVGNPCPEQMTVILQSGRKIELTGLRQRPVYGHFTLGAPRIADNDRRVAAIVATEQEQIGRTPFLIHPQQRPVELGSPEHPVRGRALLPGIVCVATFMSLKPARDENLVYSELDIVWFQHFPALPIDPGIREQIRAIEWDKHAHDFDW